MKLLVLPIILPFFASLVLALINGRPNLQKAISFAVTAYLTGWVYWLMWLVDSSGPQAVILGGWSAPYGIAFVVDRLTGIMLCLSMTVGLVMLVYTFWTSSELQQKYFFYPLMQVMLAGVNWAFLTGDLFNLFVAYEVMLLGSYGMMMVGASKAQLRQTLKYIAINSIGSTLFIVAIALIYATVGTLNFADLAQRTAELTGAQAQMVTAASMVLLVVFLMKSAAFPVFFWLPDSYPIVPMGVNGFFAGLLTKVGVYSLLRVFVMVFRQDGSELAIHVILVMSGFTMLLGVMGAMCQWEIRKILSWHIISQVGYMLMGIGLSGSADPRVVQMAVAGTVFYVVHHIIVKACLFFVGGITERVSGTTKLKQMGGVIDLAPGVAGLFLVAAFSLAGMPPFSGFLAKFVLVRSGLGGGNYFIVFISIATSFLTLYSMTKIWGYAFWHNKSREKAGANYRGMMIPTGVLVVFTIVMGLWAQPFVELGNRTADGLTDPTAYIDIVMHAHERGVPAESETHHAVRTIKGQQLSADDVRPYVVHASIDDVMRVLVDEAQLRAMTASAEVSR